MSHNWGLDKTAGLYWVASLTTLSGLLATIAMDLIWLSPIVAIAAAISCYKWILAEKTVIQSLAAEYYGCGGDA